MVYEGIPHSLRPYIWMRLGGAMNKRAQSEVTYKQIIRASSNDHLMTSKQVWSLINFSLFTGFPNILMLDSNARLSSKLLIFIIPIKRMIILIYWPCLTSYADREGLVEDADQQRVFRHHQVDRHPQTEEDTQGTGMALSGHRVLPGKFHR